MTAYGPWEAQVSPDGEPDRLLARHPERGRAGERAGAVRPGGPGRRLAQRPLHARLGLRLPARLPRPVMDREPRALVFNYGARRGAGRLLRAEARGRPELGRVVQRLRTTAQIGDGELSRDGSLLVVGAGGGLDLNNLAIYRLSANTPPDAPERVCTLPLEGRLDRVRRPDLLTARRRARLRAGRARQARRRRLRLEPAQGMHGHGQAHRPGGLDPDFGPAGF